MLRRSRYFFWLTREIAQKYTRAVIFGFLIGLSSSLLFWRVYPTIIAPMFSRVERRGIIGEFSPTTLPLSIQSHIGNGLTRISPDGTPQPDLSTSWEVTDSGKTYLFHIADDRIWHNGKKVIANDVNYNIQGVTLTALSETTLQASLPTPFSPFLTLVAKPIFQTGLRGFGDYRVNAIRLVGDRVAYVKLIPVHKNNLPVLEYRFYRTEALALLGFKLGEVDILEELTDIKPLTSKKNIEITEQVNYQRIVGLFFNLDKPLLKDKSIRQGLAYALEKFEENQAISPISKSSWAYSERVRVYTPNSAQAKKLLSSIATDSAQLTITTFPAYLDTAQRISSAWSSIGLSVSVNVVNALTDDFDVLLSAQDLPPDPDQYAFWHSTQVQTNVTNYANVKIDKLLEDGRQELDTKNRKVIYADFQRFLVDDAPAVFLYYPKTYTVKRK